jgi:hypothetical protein
MCQDKFYTSGKFDERFTDFTDMDPEIILFVLPLTIEIEKAAERLQIE